MAAAGAMAHNVYGNPITDETLKGLPEYKNKTVTEEDIAMVALSMKDTVDTGDIISQCSENINIEADRITYVLLYNATGRTVHFHKNHDFHGRLLTPPPRAIQNGQWGFFAHVAIPKREDESSGGVVYRRNTDKRPGRVDWMFSWLHKLPQISADTEIGPGGVFDKDSVWEFIYKKLEASGTHSHAEFEMWESDAEIARASVTEATYIGIMSRK